MKPLALGEMFALPVQSAIKAQNLALQETISFIEDFGLEEGQAKTFRLKTERMVERRRIDADTGQATTEFVVEPVEISVPLLALVSPPSLQLEEMQVEFGIEVLEPRTEPITSTAIPSKVLGKSLAKSICVYTPLAKANPTTMKVNMRIRQQVPEGLARLGDTLANLLGSAAGSPEPRVGGDSENDSPEPRVEEGSENDSPSTPSPDNGSEGEPGSSDVRPRPVLVLDPGLGRVVGPGPTVTEVAPHAHPVDDIPGLEASTLASLKRGGISTAEDFVKVASQASGRARLARLLAVPVKQIDEWREAAKRTVE